ncbi:MAG TPA: DedA family protein [Stellaceae bacterium]|jgi:membrane protein DedA with SNARE-associated domain|nr:DedA family protein [Stellaceae bacterium]
MDVKQIILEHGAWSYLITFAWTFFEGETFVLFAGFAAAQGLMSAPLLVVAAWLGSFVGDQCYFWIGRRFGLRVLARQPAWRARVDTALGWLKKYDAGFILTFRFIYGVRNFSSFALGISGIDWRRFLVLNFIAAGLWATLFVGIGYVFGQTLERVLGEVARDFGLVMLAGFAVLLIAFHFAHRHRRKRQRQRAAVAQQRS